MNKNTKVTAIVVVAGLTILYFAFLRKGKKWAVNTIISTGNYGLGAEKLSEFESSFLVSWAKSAEKGNEFFIYRGKTYKTKGGRAAV
jgi:hypothetical protein